ncbi:unnamed protein product, partial [Ectocarpus sp. 8 AP-2014]
GCQGRGRGFFDLGALLRRRGPQRVRLEIHGADSVRAERQGVKQEPV